MSVNGFQKKTVKWSGTIIFSIMLLIVLLLAGCVAIVKNGSSGNDWSKGGSHSHNCTGNCSEDRRGCDNGAGMVLRAPPGKIIEPEGSNRANE
jgi:hypothetical protein